MALSGKYGRVDIPRIGDDEPVFILRAQDALAEPTIGMYKLLTDSHQCELSPALQKEIDSFHGWSGLQKMPD